MASKDTVLDLIRTWSRANHSATLDLPQETKENNVQRIG